MFWKCLSSVLSWPTNICDLSERFSEHFSECLKILSGFYCTVGQAYRTGTKRCVSGLIFGNFGQDYSVFGVLIILLFYVQNCLKWPRTSKTKTETSRTYTAWHKFCKLVGSWSWLSVTSPLNASLICCRKIKQAFRVSQSRPRYLQRKFLGRRLNGFLWLSLNDRTILFLVSLLDKTVSVG